MPMYQPPDYYRPTGTGRLVDLMLRRGDIQAEAAQRSGQMWGGVARGLGDIASRYYSDKSRRQEQEAERARQAPAMAQQDELRGLQIQSERGNIAARSAEQARAKEIADAEGKAVFADSVLRFAKTAKSPAEVANYIRVTGQGAKADPATYDYLNGIADQFEVDPESMYGQLVAQRNSAPSFRKDMQEQEAARRKPVMVPEGSTYLPEGTNSLTPESRFGWQKETAPSTVGDTIGTAAFTAPRAAKPESRSLEIQAAEALSRGDRKAYEQIVKVQRELGNAGRGPTQPRVDNKIWVMRPGADGKMQTVFVPESQVQHGDQPANTRSGEGRPSLGGEKSALGFFNRAKQADEELKALSPQITSKGLGGQAYMAMAPNFMQTQEGQAYLQAQRAFTEARLRKDSGAAIPEQEFNNDRMTYFAQPGDSAETAAQKERGRAAVLASLAFQSGRALNEFYGDEAEPLLEGFKARQSGSQKPDASKPAGIITTPDGKKWKNIGGRMVEQR